MRSNKIFPNIFFSLNLFCVETYIWYVNLSLILHFIYLTPACISKDTFRSNDMLKSQLIYAN